MAGPATTKEEEEEEMLLSGKRARATSPSNDRASGAPSSLMSTAQAALADPTGGHGSVEPRLRLPRGARFPLIVVLSFALSALSYTRLHDWAGVELAAVMKQLSRSEMAAWAGWRLLELALGWVGDFDSYDMLSLSFLSQSPVAYLLYTFYSVQPQAAVAFVLLDITASCLPFRLLRPAPPSAPSGEEEEDIARDLAVALPTSLLGAAIYSISLFAAGWCSVLPHVLVLYFTGVPTVERAAGARWPGENPLALHAVALLSGFAVWRFVFAPAVVADRRAEHVATRSAATTSADGTRDNGNRTAEGQTAEFDPAAATLGETLRWNVWTGHSPMTRTAVVRTAALATVVFGKTALAGLAIKGVETYGAAAYGGIWATAAVAAGLGLALVGSG